MLFKWSFNDCNINETPAIAEQRLSRYNNKVSPSYSVLDVETWHLVARANNIREDDDGEKEHRDDRFGGCCALGREIRLYPRDTSPFWCCHLVPSRCTRRTLPYLQNVDVGVICLALPHAKLAHLGRVLSFFFMKTNWDLHECDGIQNASASFQKPVAARNVIFFYITWFFFVKSFKVS